MPYLPSTDPTTWYDGYRRDCSGYASIALGLGGPGLDTTRLAARSTPIGKNDLRPGDLLINPSPDSAGHVVIFDDRGIEVIKQTLESSSDSRVGA